MNILTATDGYHITMGYLMGEAGMREEETHVLYARSGGPQVVSNLTAIIARYLGYGLSASDVEDASAFWSEWGVPFPLEAWREIARRPTLPIAVRGVPDGTVVRPGEPIAVITAPALLAAIPEPFLIGEVMKSTQVATRFTKAAKAVGWERNRLFEVGLRAAVSVRDHSEMVQTMAEVGLGLSSSGDAARAAGIASGGSMGHRFTQRFATDREAFEQAVVRMLEFKRNSGRPGKMKVSLLLDTRDTLGAGLAAALQVMERYFEAIARNLDLSVRLDSGDLEQQLRILARTFRARFAARGWLPAIIVESGLTPEAIVRLERIAAEEGYPKVKMMYGIGGYLVGAINRDQLSMVYKLSSVAGRPTMKFANEAERGKESYPGNITLMERARGQLQRQIALADEVPALEQLGWREVFTDIAIDGVMVRKGSSPKELLTTVTKEWERVAGGYIGNEKYPAQFGKPALSRKVAGLVERLRREQVAQVEARPEFDTRSAISFN